MTHPTFDELLAQRDYLERLARSLVRNAQEADDLIQDVWVEASTRPPRKSTNLRAWLRVVTSRVLWRSRRRRRAETERLSQLDPDEIQSAPAVAPEREHACRTLAHAVAELREPYRTVIVLRFFEELPPRAIVARTGRTIDTVNSQLKRGMALLRERLTREYGDEVRWTGAFVGLFGSPGRRAAVASTGVFGLGAWLTWCIGTAVLVAGVWIVTRDDETGADDSTATSVDEPTRVESARDDIGDVALESASTEHTRRPSENTSTATSSATSPARTAAPSSLASEFAEPSLLVTTLDSRGAPIAGARVEVVWRADPDRFEFEPLVFGPTAADGTVEISCPTADLPSADLVQLEALADGHVRSFRAWTGLPDRPRVPVTLTLEDDGAILFACVVDEGGQPLRDTRVLVGERIDEVERDGVRRRRSPRIVRTNALGEFRADGLRLAPTTVRIAAEHADPFEAFLRPSVDPREPHRIVLRPGRELSGRVVDEAGAPVANARVSTVLGWLLEPRETQSDHDGRFTLTGLPSAPRWVFAERVDGAAWDARLVDVQRNAECELVLATRAGLALRFVDDEAQPLVAAGVLLKHGFWTREVVTDERGEIRLSRVPRAPLTASVHATGADQRNGFGALARFGGLEASAELCTLVVPADAARLAGLLVRPSGTVSESAMIWVVDPQGAYVDSAFPDPATGAFSTDPQIPGRYRVCAVDMQLGVAALAEVELGDRGTHDLGRLVLPEVGKLELQWHWPDGHLLELSAVVESGPMRERKLFDPANQELEVFAGPRVARVLLGTRIVEERWFWIQAGRTTTFVTGPEPRRDVTLSVRAALGLGDLRLERDAVGLGAFVLTETTWHAGPSSLPLEVGRWRVAAPARADGRPESLREFDVPAGIGPCTVELELK